MAVELGYIGLNARNPVNIKQPTVNVEGWWKGSIGRDAAGHAIFLREEYAFRAFCIEICGDENKRGKNTLRELAADYAPKNDEKADNDPVAWATFVANRLDIMSIDQELDLFAPNGRPTSVDFLVLVIAAVIEIEQYNGCEFPVETIRSGIAMYIRDRVRR